MRAITHHVQTFALHGRAVARRLWPLLVAIMVTFTPARAAEIRIDPEANGAILRVTLSGPIQPRDVRRFRNATSRARAAVVELASVGGDAAAALSIARMVRERGFDTMVTAGAECAGPCVLVWLAGTTRSLHVRGLVRMHLTTGIDDRVGIPGARTDLVTIERVLHVEFGHSIELAWAITRSHPSSARDLTPAMATIFGLEVIWLSSSRPEYAVAPSPLDRSWSTHVAGAAEQDAIGLVQNFMRWKRLGKPLNEGIISHFYASSIRYYGEVMTRRELAARQHLYRRRAPEERVVPAGEPEAVCEWDGKTCTVQLIGNLHGYRDAWGRKADAVLAYRFVVRGSGGRFRIAEETREVLGADMRPFTSADSGLIRRIQAELWRLNCRHGPMDGWWDFTTALGLKRFHEKNGTRPVEDGPTLRDLALMEANPAPICLR